MYVLYLFSSNVVLSQKVEFESTRCVLRMLFFLRCLLLLQSKCAPFGRKAQQLKAFVVCRLRVFNGRGLRGQKSPRIELGSAS